MDNAVVAPDSVSLATVTLVPLLIVAAPPAIAIVPAPVSVPPSAVDGPEKVSVPVAAFTVPVELLTNEAEMTSLPVPAVFSNSPLLMKDDAVERPCPIPLASMKFHVPVAMLVILPALPIASPIVTAPPFSVRVFELKSENAPPITVPDSVEVPFRVRPPPERLRMSPTPAEKVPGIGQRSAQRDARARARDRSTSRR